tara:strand:+ start:498 stop:761 length:264 start_codon:yes stop_codon:yes gene_type:complete
MWTKSFIDELQKLAIDTSFGAMRDVSREDPALMDEVKDGKSSSKVDITPKKAPVKKHTKEQRFFMSNEKGINTKKKDHGTVNTIQEM